MAFCIQWIGIIQLNCNAENQDISIEVYWKFLQSIGQFPVFHPNETHMVAYPNLPLPEVSNSNGMKKFWCEKKFFFKQTNKKFLLNSFIGISIYYYLETIKEKENKTNHFNIKHWWLEIERWWKIEFLSNLLKKAFKNFWIII